MDRQLSKLKSFGKQNNQPKYSVREYCQANSLNVSMFSGLLSLLGIKPAIQAKLGRSTRSGHGSRRYAKKDLVKVHREYVRREEEKEVQQCKQK